MRKLPLFLTAILLLLLPCCNRQEAENPAPVLTERGTMEAEQVFQGLELPSNYENDLSGTLTWPLQAQEYGTSFALDSSEEEIRRILNTEDSTLSPVLGVTNTGLKLSSNEPYLQALMSAFPYSPSLRDRPGEQRMGVIKADYSARDLAFMPLEEARTQVMAMLAALGLDGAEPELACALDRENLEKNMQVYASMLRSGGELPPEMEEALEARLAVSFGEDSECYFFSFHLNIGEDPVFTATATDARKEISGAELYCLYGPAGGATEQPGFIALDILRVPTEMNGGGEQPVLSPDKAAEAVLPRLKEVSEQVRLEALDFCYCYYNNDAVLHPTWVFTISNTREQGDNVWTETIYYAVDAITGELVNQ